MKAFRTVLIIVAVIILLPLLGFLGWFLKKGHPMEVVVINKSMLNFCDSENKSINWVLNDHKILTSGNRKYDMKTDYYGFHETGDDYRIRYPRLRELDRMTEKSDLVYFADVTGVTRSMKEASISPAQKELVYGGLNNTDYVFCRKLIEAKKPLVVECNFFGPPTEPLVRYNVEQLTDVYYVGWMGKYVKDLTRFNPEKDGYDWQTAYQEYTGESWSFSGPGIVFVNQENDRVVVLREEEDMQTADGLIITTDEAMEKFHLPAAVNYCGWFTIVHPGKNKVLSQFMLNPTALGIEKLRMNGLPDEFPAIIQPADQFYFLAGDFGKTRVNLAWSRVMVLNDLVAFLRGSGNNATGFFYSYYKPFMDEVLSDAREGSSLQN